MKVLHDWLHEYCGKDIPSVEKLDEMLTFHAFEIDGIETKGEHTVIDVKVLPDRAGDCLSHRGIAREVAALTGVPLAHDPFAQTVDLLPVAENLTATIADDASCNRLALARVEGVAVGESPVWLKSRLEALGQRSINNVVDATNYVMLALGQPIHAYDAQKLAATDGASALGVRMAREGETITTLTGDVYTLTPQIQLIVDSLTDTPLSIAGIKGGKTAEVDAQTTDLVIEAAHFDASITRKASQTLRLQTDASKRFENNPSPELVSYALTEVVRLILEIAGGTCTGYADAYPQVSRNAPVHVTLEHTNALLGTTLVAEAVEDIFGRLGFSYTPADGGWQVTAPFERRDVLIAEDVIADVGRVYGYEHIASVVPAPVPLTEYNAKQYYSEKIRAILVREGFSEVITSSFRKKDVITLQNALASDKGALRSTLTPNMQEVLDKNTGNTDLLGIPSVQAFEIGTVFYKSADGTDVAEHASLALGVRLRNAYTPKDDARLGEVVALLERELGVALEGAVQHGVYECNLSALIARLPAPTAYPAYVPLPAVTFAPYSQYPYITRDIALWVGEGVAAHDVEALIRAEAGALLTRLTLFDEFQKDGKTSYAFRLIFQSFEKTLTDLEIAPTMETLNTTLRARGYEIR